MEIRWQVDDGYCGGSRPHTTTINDDELKDMTEEQKTDYINECIQHDFDETIGWFIL